jgi:Cu2+-exporting ATPase
VIDSPADNPADSSAENHGDCTLCGLDTPDPPVTDADVPGTFCCRGCLEVSRTLDDPAAMDAETARAEVASDGGGIADSDAAAAKAPETAPDGEEAYLSVEGMHCASCEAFLEGRAVNVEGVLAADANFPADAMRVTCAEDEDVDLDAVADAISGVGYEATALADGEAAGEREETETLGRIIVGGFFGMMVMLWYVLFLYPTYFGLPSEALLFDIHGDAGGFLLGNVWALTTVVLGYTGAPLLRGAYVAARTRQPNMDLLVSIAAVTAYLYSTLAVLVGRVEVYFDVTVVVIVAVTIGTYYENRVKNRAVSKLTDLTRERVSEARRRTAEGTETIPTEAVEEGDELIVRPGERIPLDGEILEGEAGIDESLVTGESLPVRRGPGDDVRGGTLVTDGRLVVAADAEGERTLDRVVSLLWDARGEGGTPQRFADALATLFVPVVLALGAAAFVIHLALGATPTAALLTGLAVLVVSCPCALGLATPLAVAAGTRSLLENGVVLADGSAVEAAAEVDTVAFDKTGTLTTGEMRVTDVHTAERVSEEAVLGYAAAVEARSDHPVADAVIDAAAELESEGEVESQTTLPAGPDTDVSDFETHPGRGVSGRVSGAEAVGNAGTTRVTVGDESLFPDAEVPDELREEYQQADDAGDLAAYVGWSGDSDEADESSSLRVVGVLIASDDHRAGWREAVAQIADGGPDGGRRVVVLTGDSGAAAERIADAEGVDEVYAGLPPEAKTETIRRLRREGTVAMVGDGSNDAPALAAADVGIAVATGTELAADAADAVLLTSDLAAVDATLSILAGTRRRVRENLTWAFGYNAVAVPAAVLGVVTPLLAAVAMSASSLLVVANSTRSLAPDAAASGASEAEESEVEESEAGESARRGEDAQNAGETPESSAAAVADGGRGADGAEVNGN